MFQLGTFGKIKDKLVEYRNMFTDWITTTGLGVFWIILVILAVVVGCVVLVGLTLGLSVGIPALILYFALNWVVPVFGGPSIGYWTAVGLVILIPIVARLVHGGK